MAREPHKVTLVLDDDGVVLRLLCPEGSCEPAQSCSECGWQAGDGEAKRCEFCPREGEWDGETLIWRVAEETPDAAR